MVCALFRTYCQVLAGFGQGADSVPVLAAQRQLVGHQFAGDDQHDVFEFLEGFLDCARSWEMAAARCSFWAGVQLTDPVATHLERLFGFVLETRRRCKVCRGQVRSWFSSEKVLRVSPQEDAGGPYTVTEMYLASCAAVEHEFKCVACGRDTAHESQSQIFTAPNVLVVQVRRGAGPRLRVAVEEVLDLPGLPSMTLVGVVYHRGETPSSGHYTCLCRGPQGRFWYYDDNRPVQREQQEVAHVKPSQVYMAVYCRSDGSGSWRQDAVAGDAIEVDGLSLIHI